MSCFPWSPYEGLDSEPPYDDDDGGKNGTMWCEGGAGYDAEEATFDDDDDDA